MIDWPKGKKLMPAFRKQVRKNLQAILYGKVLVVDPASNRLGWSTITEGEISGQGIIEVHKANTSVRLQELVQTLQDEDRVDLLAVEMIRGNRAHIVLKWAVGCVVGSVPAPHLIEVPIQAWKAWAGPDHEKDDDTDAVAMAETLLAIAHEENT